MLIAVSFAVILILHVHLRLKPRHYVSIMELFDEKIQRLWEKTDPFDDLIQQIKLARKKESRGFSPEARMKPIINFQNSLMKKSIEELHYNYIK